MAKKYKVLAIFCGILFLFIGFIFISNKIIEKTAKGKTYQKIQNIPHNKVGLVLGTSKYLVKGGINAYFKYRIEAAVRLYNSGKIDFILVSGDNGSKYHNEPLAFKKELVERGIPKDKIILDYAGFRTLDSVIRCKKIFGQKKVTIISQKFQNERAIYLAIHHGIEAVGFNAKDVHPKQGFSIHIREYFARCKAILDILFNTQPKYLGKKLYIQ